MGAKKVLIIEDESYLLEMYKMRFEQGGYEVMVAEDGESGLSMARKGQPDIVLLDIMLPKMNGYQVLEEIRKNADTEKLKVYVLSNLGQSVEIKKGMEGGANGYFVKSNLTPTQLFTDVEKILSGGQPSMSADETENLTSPRNLAC